MQKKNDKNPFEVLHSKEIYRNPWITVREDKVIRPGGKAGIFGVMTVGAGVSVLPIDQRGNVYLTKEYRYGVGRYEIEVCNGSIDKGETPTQAAERELAEECGITAKKWTDVGLMDMMGTVGKLTMSGYIAQNLKIGEQDLEEGEVIEVQKMPFKRAQDMVMSGEITQATTIILILKAQKILNI
jgi:8-oxo-dGTP pyrophosphatase MutT (NUDIX family)